MSRNLKYITLLLLTILLLSFCSCQNQEDEEANVPTPEELLAAQYDAMITSLGDDFDDTDIISYVSGWSENEKISSHLTENGILIMTKDASKGYGKTPPAAFICTIPETADLNDTEYVSVMLYLMKYLPQHTKVYGVLAPEGKTKLLPEDITSCDRIIYLEYSEKPALILSCAASSSYQLTKDIQKTDQRFDLSYRIKIKGLKGENINSTEDSHPNAILNISSLLAGCKTSGLLYDLSYFKGGSGYDSYSRKATAIVSISRNDQEKFEKKLDKAIEKFDKKWKDQEPNAQYTYEIVDTPKKVFAQEDTDQMISLLYTMITGSYAEHEQTGECLAYSNIAGINIQDGTCTVRMKTFSKEDSILAEMDDSVRTLSKISGFSYHKIQDNQQWNEPEDSDFLASLNQAAESAGTKLPDASSVFRTHECSILKEINPDAHAVSISVSIENWEDVSNTLTEYVKQK